MSECKDLESCSSEQTVDFTVELLPAAKRTALLYKLTYLYLSGSPELEELIRSRALATRLLFISSEKVLFKCVFTSQNLVKSLFPILKVAVEENETELAKTYLGKAQKWIEEIITASGEVVDKYEAENKALDKTTTNINAKRAELKNDTDETRKLNKKLETFKKEMEKITKERKAKQKEIDDAQGKLEKHIEHMTRKDRNLAIRTSVIPFLGDIVYGLVKVCSDGPDVNMLKSLESVYNKHRSEMEELRNKEEKLQNEMMDISMKLINLEIKENSLPSPEHLDGVKTCLAKIQTILLEIQRFWNKVKIVLEGLEKDTFSGKELVERLGKKILKDIFLESITDAEKGWAKFGQLCITAQKTFDVQAKDAYKFLEMTPSSLSKEDKEKQLDAVKRELNKLCRPQLAIEGSPASQQVSCK